MKKIKTIHFSISKKRQAIIALFIGLSSLSTAMANEKDSENIQQTTTNTEFGLSQIANAEQKESDSYEKLQQRIWKRKSYLYLGYGNQNLKSDYYSVKSDFSFSILLGGRTYYLHKKPIAGKIKFGIDTNLDVNFAKYPNLEPENEDSHSSSVDGYDEYVDSEDLNFMQLDAGFGLGPSITYNPVGQLKAALYFHVTPTYSMIIQNSELYKHYATFFNVGFTLSYKAKSLGLESRWCGKTNFDKVALTQVDKIYDENGEFHDPFESIGNKLKTNNFRIFIGFRW